MNASSTAYTNLIRTAVGIGSLAELAEVQEHFRTMTSAEGRKAVIVTTRNKPTRENDLLNGGSVYWIIRNVIRARQAVIDIQVAQDEEGRNFCQIFLDPTIMLVHPVDHRAIQGWRYLPPERAPADAGRYDASADTGESDNIPPEMESELKALGLL